MSFNESNTVEQMILDALSADTTGGNQPLELKDAPGWGASLGKDMAGAAAHWEYVPANDIPRQPGDVMVEPWLRQALIRLNPEIAAQPDRADEVIYTLRAILLPCRRTDWSGRMRISWIGCEARRRCPLAPTASMCSATRGYRQSGRQPTRGHQPMDLSGRHCGEAVRRGVRGQRTANRDWRGEDAHAQRGDLVRWRLPGATRFTKSRCRRCSCRTSFPSPPRASRSATAPSECRWTSGARGAHGRTSRRFAGRRAEVGGEHAPPAGGAGHPAEFHAVRHGQEAPPDQDHLPLPAVFTTNQIVERVVQGNPKKGLIWHFQGSGKSLLMVFAAQKLRMHPARQSDRNHRGGPH